MSALKVITLPLWLPFLIVWTAVAFVGRALWLIFSSLFKLALLFVIVVAVIFIAWW